MTESQLRYVLGNIIPEMCERGFSIKTACGELSLDGESEAQKQFISQLKNEFEKRLIEVSRNKRYGVF
ncbi:hypothetical protein [Pectobacterium sp. A5351]|uniref:hypothetical protein n=1 Tax=Pectobacterium sp. A5351 TaxID=2914983 RepID=UPI00232E75C8|nr:hypothetical protein [Pectobacterium sp. A5351]WCG84510.1 hypothetical protein O1Q74_07800 [Pectobacterium sp. A5351]